jgi:hypothetical protein
VLLHVRLLLTAHEPFNLSRSVNWSYSKPIRLWLHYFRRFNTWFNFLSNIRIQCYFKLRGLVVCNWKLCLGDNYIIYWRYLYMYRLSSLSLRGGWDLFLNTKCPLTGSSHHITFLLKGFCRILCCRYSDHSRQWSTLGAISQLWVNPVFPVSHFNWREWKGNRGKV